MESSLCLHSQPLWFSDIIQAGIFQTMKSRARECDSPLLIRRVIVDLKPENRRSGLTQMITLLGRHLPFWQKQCFSTK